MKKFVSVAAATIAVVPVLAAGAVFADSPGKFGTAPDEYLVKNVTKSTSYATTASATCNEELKYSIRLHNSNFGSITGITVIATLPNANGVSKSDMSASGKSSDGSTTTTSGSVTVTLGAKDQTLGYEAGSTALYNQNDQLVKNLPDGITGSGVNVGDLAGSTAEFVTFKAKVSCPTTPVTPPTTPPATTTTPTTPTVLPNTGAGNVIGVVAGAMVAGTLAGRLFLSRRLARKA